MKTIVSLIISTLFTFHSEPAFFVNGTVTDINGNSLQGVTVLETGTTNSVSTDVNGFYTIEVNSEKSVLRYSSPTFKSRELNVGSKRIIDVVLTTEVILIDADEEKEESMMEMSAPAEQNQSRDIMFSGAYKKSAGNGMRLSSEPQNWNTEEYATIHENGFKRPKDAPLSTFSIDVDAASYSNVRRFLNNGQLPPKDAVRIEEMINYFGYDYENPIGEDPFSINPEISKAPWNDEHLLVQIGIQGQRIETDDLPGSNLVFLLDVSGSMNAPNKLPLLKSSMKLLTNELREDDRVSIVVYAGAAGLVLPPTRGTDKKAIMKALDRLSAGGSTAGGAGINLAYKVAKEQFIEGGNNRIILATDGDFNIGESSNASMERLIEEKRKEGVFLTVLGFGMGNYKDSKMEILADKGNGNYAYIDNIMEAKKVLVNEFGGTLFTIAKDVKIQVEFNPKHVGAYRLIGYENRMLETEDFNDDKKDAGELGSAHTVTALYEIIPAGIESSFIKDIDPLKYQSEQEKIDPDFDDELLTVKFRYKAPDSNKSKLITKSLSNETRRMSANLEWATAVAGFGMLLRDSEYKGSMNYEKVLALANKSKGEDAFGYRAEFIRLVEAASHLDTNTP